MVCKNYLTLSLAVVCLTRFVATDYIAAVVEFQSQNGTTPYSTVELNLNEYVHFMEQAQKSSAQIIVFPEYGLTGLVDIPDEYAIEIPAPSDNTTYSNYWLEILSKASVANSLYTVVNLLEKEKDSFNNTFYYNTNIVFDKSGKIVAKYRKINLYEEPALTSGSIKQDQNIFTTDFGVTFGTFICYDITSYYPAKSILTNTSVTDIVYPTAWFSYLPFFHSLSIQSGYALANKVNILASNLNSVKDGIGGSGVYGAQGEIFTQYMSGAAGSKIQIATVKNTQRPTATFGFDFDDQDVPTLDNFEAKRYFLSEKYEFRRLNLNQKIIKEEVCHKYFCCVFTVNVSSATPSDVYKVMAFKGQVRAGEIKDMKICSLVACENEDIKTCGTRATKPTTKFQSITVETKTPDEPEQFFIPFSLTDDLVPVPKAAFNSTVNPKRQSTYVVSNFKENIIALGIIGSNGNVLSISYVLMFILFLSKWIFN